MAETAAQIRTRLKAEYPTLTRQEDGQIVVMGATEYNATIEQWVLAQAAQQTADTAQVAKVQEIATRKSGVNAALTTLNGAGNLSVAQLRVQVAELAASVKLLIDAL
jgi:hypothetical protein